MRTRAIPLVGGLALAAALLLAAPAAAAHEEVVLSIAGRTARLAPERFQDASGEVHAVLALSHIPSGEERETLRALGVSLHQYLPDLAWFATVPADRSADLLALPWVRSAEPFRPEWKGRPPVVERPHHSLWLRDDGRSEVAVYFFPDVPRAAAHLLLAGLGADVVSDTWSRNERLVAALDAGLVPALLARDEVRWIETGRRLRGPANQSAAAFCGVDEAHDPPFGLDGTGAKVGVMDGDRVQADHTDFGSRVTVVETLGGSPSFHPTHVTGTILGSGAGNGAAKGMAPGARAWTWTYEVDDFVAAKSSGIPQYGILVDNNSWGPLIGWEVVPNGWIWIDNTDQFGAYDATVGDLDDLARDEGVLLTFAAGNDWTDDGYDGWGYYYFGGQGYYGHYDVDPDTYYWTWHYGYHPPDGGSNRYSNLLTYAALKNGLSVGAVYDNGDPADFSSIGPCKDGRLKPDLSAVGVNVLSTVPTDAWASSDGTSMATPVVTGIAALVIEAWNDSHSGADPRLDVLKGLLIHATFDLGRTGPDYLFGFGAVDVPYAAALALLDDGVEPPHHATGSLSNGGSMEVLVDASDGPGLLWATLCWTDPPGNPAAQKALVNDLDLVLESPSGTLHYPWKLNPSQPGNDATRGVNGLDNVEQAEVSSPEAGIWTVRVSGSAVPSGSQPFAVWFSRPYANLAPTADAGDDRAVAATSPAGAWVFLTAAASTDPNQGDTLTFRWDTDGDGDFGDEPGSSAGPTASLLLSMGGHTVGLRATDDGGLSDDDSVIVTVLNSPPVASLGGSRTLRADDPQGATLTLDTSFCTDPQTSGDIASVTWDLDGDGVYGDSTEASVTRRFTIGPHTVGLRVTDRGGLADFVVETLTVVGAEHTLHHGGSFKGQIDLTTDTDSFFVEAVTGTAATFTLKTKTPVTLDVEGPGRTLVLATETGFSRKIRIVKTLEDTGWYWVEVGPGGPGAVGAYSLAVKLKAPKLGEKATVLLTAAVPRWERSVDLLEGAKLTAKASGKGVRPVLELLDEEERVVASDGGTGKMKVDPVAKTGSYRLRVSDGGEGRFGSWKFAWKAVQPKKGTKIREGR